MRPIRARGGREYLMNPAFERPPRENNSSLGHAAMSRVHEVYSGCLCGSSEQKEKFIVGPWVNAAGVGDRFSFLGEPYRVPAPDAIVRSRRMASAGEIKRETGGATEDPHSTLLPLLFSLRTLEVFPGWSRPLPRSLRNHVRFLSPFSPCSRHRPRARPRL